MAALRADILIAGGGIGGAQLIHAFESDDFVARALWDHLCRPDRLRGESP